MHWNSSTCNLLGTSHSIFYTLITSLLGVLRSTVVVFSQGKNCSSSCSCINCLNKPIKTKKWFLPLWRRNCNMKKLQEYIGGKQLFEWIKGKLCLFQNLQNVLKIISLVEVRNDEFYCDIRKFWKYAEKLNNVTKFRLSIDLGRCIHSPFTRSCLEYKRRFDRNEAPLSASQRFQQKSMTFNYEISTCTVSLFNFSDTLGFLPRTRLKKLSVQDAICSAVSWGFLGPVMFLDPSCRPLLPRTM